MLITDMILASIWPFIVIKWLNTSSHELKHDLYLLSLPPPPQQKTIKTVISSSFSLSTSVKVMYPTLIWNALLCHTLTSRSYRMKHYRFNVPNRTLFPLPRMKADSMTYAPSHSATSTHSNESGTFKSAFNWAICAYSMHIGSTHIHAS